MSPHEIAYHLGKAEIAWSETAFSEFCRVMQDKNYGYEETVDAWVFFSYGWNAMVELSQRLIRAKAT